MMLPPHALQLSCCSAQKPHQVFFSHGADHHGETIQLGLSDQTILCKRLVITCTLWEEEGASSLWDSIFDHGDTGLS